MWNKKRKRFFFQFSTPWISCQMNSADTINSEKKIDQYFILWRMVVCKTSLMLAKPTSVRKLWNTVETKKKVQVSQEEILKLLVQSFKFHDVSNSNVKFLSKNSADYSIISKHESILQASFLMLKMHTIPSERALIDISFGTTTTSQRRRCSNSSSLLLWTDRRTDVLLTELISLYGPQPNTKVGFI